MNMLISLFRNIIIFLSSFFFFFIFYLVNPFPAYAQTCGGSGGSVTYTPVTCDQNPRSSFYSCDSTNNPITLNGTCVPSAGSCGPSIIDELSTGCSISNNAANPSASTCTETDTHVRGNGDTCFVVGNSCTPDGSCQTSGATCCNGSHADGNCSSGTMCGPSGGGGGGGSCDPGSTCFTGIANCGAVGYVGGSGSCNGGLCCKPNGGGATSTSQGVRVYCQDGNGTRYPMPGVIANLTGHNADGTGSGTVYTPVPALTDNGGVVMFGGLSTFPYQHFEGWLPNLVGGVHPFAGTYAANLIVPGTGQKYSELTVGDTHNSIFANCDNLQGGFSGYVPFLTFFCENGSPANWAPSVRYRFDVGTEGAYGMQYHFSNCTPLQKGQAAVSCTQATGWACDGKDYNVPLTVAIYDGARPNNGDIINGSIPAGTDNGDPNVKAACGGVGTHSFTYNFSPALSSGSHQIWIMGNGLDQNNQPNGNNQFGLTVGGSLPPVTVNCDAAWWQVAGGDAISGMSFISSNVPVVPVPQKFTVPSSGNPLSLGNAIFAQQGNLNLGNTSFLTNSSYGGRVYDYTYFSNLASSDSNIIWNDLPANTDQGDLASGRTSPDGYTYFKSNGSVTIAGKGSVKINGNNMYVLFVNGDLNIAGNINIQKYGVNFIMAIVSGNINVAANVTAAGGPAIEGIYEADNNFDLQGAGNSPFYVRGTVVAYKGVNLSRDLGGSNNSVAPAETFEYAPDLTLLFPRSLVQDTINWQEVLP